jgi:hypothetical protein
VFLLPPRHPASTIRSLTALLALLIASPAIGQQVPDTAFAPPVVSPAFAPGMGPVVLIDEGHHNFHTLGGRFSPFARLVARAGFPTRPHTGPFTRAGLDSARVLVISNALAERNEDAWYLPIASAFDTSEVRVVERWVREGGSLLLAVDHIPFGGAAADLAAMFGVFLSNGFAQDANGNMNFMERRREGSLHSHPVTDGRGPGERVDSVMVYTGEAFRTSAPVDTLLAMGPGSTLLLPTVAWEFSPLTPQLRADGMLVAAALTHGRGRVVVFGEAAMLTAQLAGPQRIPVGMNAAEAVDNSRLVLNTVRWLAGVTGAPGGGARSDTKRPRRPR